MFIGDELYDYASVSLTIKDASGRLTTHNVAIPQETYNLFLYPEDLVYLQAKGCLLIPPSELCDELLRCYFLHVHMSLPLLNGSDLLHRYVEGGPMNVNLMLLWAIFLAGSHFMPQASVTKAGFNSRDEMCESYFIRTKTLLDLNYLGDKQVRSQCIILMAYWRPPFNREISYSWHLIGMAIATLQSLFPKFDGTRTSGSTTGSTCESVWRRMWWCCIKFDVLGSITGGRRLRVKSTENTVPMPLLNDVLDELRQLPSSIQEDYLPPNIERLGRYYFHHLNIVQIMSEVLTQINNAESNAPSIQEISNWEQRLENSDEKFDLMLLEDTKSSDRWVKLAAYYYQICTAGNQVCFFRLFLLLTPFGLEGAKKQEWLSELNRKISAAANLVISALETLTNLDLLSYHRHWLVTPLLAVTQFYLIQMSSTQPLERKVARHKVDMCILILEELQKVNWFVDFMLKVVRSALGCILASEQSFETQRGDTSGGRGTLEAQVSFDFSAGSAQQTVGALFPMINFDENYMGFL